MQGNFTRLTRIGSAALLMALASLAPLTPAGAEPRHGIAMYGPPALPPDFVSLPYANPDAPRGGTLVEGAVGGFDSLNPFQRRGNAPWQLRFYAYESLMARNLDEPFGLYGLLAESVEVAPDRSWVEYTLRPEARFSDGSPVTVEDVIWSYQTLGEVGHLRYRGFAAAVDSITRTGPHSLRISFNQDNPELALIAGMRPVLQKSQWQDRRFEDGTIHDIPLGSAPYVVTSYEIGRSVTLTRNPDYWGKDLPIRCGTQNFDRIVLEYFGDETVLFEAFKSGRISVFRESNAERWATQFDFPAVAEGRVVLSELTHGRPSGMTGLAFNSLRPHLADWRVRAALLSAFNYPAIADTLTGGREPRITSYFGNSDLAMRAGAAPDPVRDLLAPHLPPHAADLPPDALEALTLPEGDAQGANRGDLRRATRLLADAGWTVQDGGLLRDAAGQPFVLRFLIRQGDGQSQAVVQAYRAALARLGITAEVRVADNAGFIEAEAQLDFDMIPFRRDMSLSPGNEQRLYWHSDGAGVVGTRNIPGVRSPAVDAMIDALLQARSPEEFTAATRALDRALMAGRYVIPLWSAQTDRIAHANTLKFPENRPIYGDRPGWFPDVWWHDAP